jgi:hypothetical protein
MTLAHTPQTGSSDQSPAEPVQPRATLTTKEAARRLGLAASTLARFRMTGGGPDYVKLSDTTKGRVFYTEADLQKFLHRRTQKAAQPANAG